MIRTNFSDPTMLRWHADFDAALIEKTTTRNAAAKLVRDEANALIEQMERFENGWDKGAFRNDDTMREVTIGDRIRLAVDFAFMLSRKFNATHEVRMSRAQHDFMFEHDHALLSRLFATYTRSWSLYGVTFHAVTTDDREAIRLILG